MQMILIFYSKNLPSEARTQLCYIYSLRSIFFWIEYYKIPIRINLWIYKGDMGT